MPIDRRQLMTGLGGLAAASASSRPVAALSRTPQEAEPSLRQDPELVREVVGAAHFDLDRVRELVDSRPELARASWDWGFGDWESALGAASHTGRIEIVEVLLDRGARPNLFTFAVLGHLEAVRAMIEALPGLQGTTGPHGLTLLHHARVGGERARPVREYLEGLGGADPAAVDSPLDQEIRGLLIGRYRSLSGRELVVEPHRLGPLSLALEGGAARMLFHRGDLRFHPAGAPSVTVRFELDDTGRVTLSIVRPEDSIVAERIGDV